MKREGLTLCLFTLVVGQFGCSSAGGLQTRRVAFVLPQGWVKAESDDKGVAIGVPSGWRYGANSMFGVTNPFESIGTSDSNGPPISPEDKKSTEDLMKGMSQVVKEDERRNLEALAAKGIILHCVSTGKPTIGEELTRFYVKKKSQNANWTWPEIDVSEQDCFLTKQKSTEVKLPIGLAHRMQATWQLVDGSNYSQISYLVPNGNDLFVLRFITVESQDIIVRIEKEVSDSLRIN